MQSQLGPFIRSLRGSSLFKTAGSCVRNTTVTHRGTLYNDQKNRQLFSERNNTKCNNFMNITARSSLNYSRQIKITHKSLQIGDLIFRQYSTQNTEITKDEETPVITPDPAEPPPKERKIPKSLFGKYLELAKFRLASLVIVTTVGGYFMAPDPIDWGVMTAAAVGTTLAIASANSINQYIEVDNDLKMRRTANRMLPSGAMSLNHALGFGVVTGILGSVLLAAQVNVLAAGLAFSNILLYTLVYTPLKRVTPLNTWVGSVVGAIPPMIGWVANTGSLDPGAWALFIMMFIWQMPHFFALSWPLRTDYARAGYRMLSVTHPHKVSQLTLRYSYYLLPMGALCAATGVTTWYFALDSLIPAIYMIYYAHLFHRDYKQTFKYKEQKQQERQERFNSENSSGHSEEHNARSENKSGSGAGSTSGPKTGTKATIGQSNVWARKTFFASLFYVPILLLLMILHKEERRTDPAIKKLKNDADEEYNSEIVVNAK